jgi:hypothetical protein
LLTLSCAAHRPDHHLNKTTAVPLLLHAMHTVNATSTHIVIHHILRVYSIDTLTWQGSTLSCSPGVYCSKHIAHVSSFAVYLDRFAAQLSVSCCCCCCCCCSSLLLLTLAVLFCLLNDSGLLSVAVNAAAADAAADVVVVTPASLSFTSL